MTDATLPLAGRLLAVDLGDVRIGLALCDAGQLVASPLRTLPVEDVASSPDDVEALAEAILQVASDEEAVGIVVGYPRTLSGREGAAARHAREVAEAVARRGGVAVDLWDERFTTAEAERMMIEQDASRRERRGAIDRVAASLILQGYLDAQRRRREERAWH